MGAALPSSSSPPNIPRVTPPPSPDIPRDSGLDPTHTIVVPSAEVVAEARSDGSITSLSPAPRTQSTEQPPGLLDPPVRVELHLADLRPAPLSAPARPHSAVTVSHIERHRPLPSIPANAALVPQTDALLRPRVVSDPGQGHPHRRSHRSYRSHHSEPPPPQPLDIPGSGIYRQRLSIHPSEFDYRDVSPARVQSPFQSAYPLGSVGARLEPTLKEALKVKDKAAWQAKWTAYSINIAIALQVLLGALTTALGASLSGSQIRISVASLGSLATLVASYIARTRGSSEPETSLLREHELEKFIRRLRSFVLDVGSQDGHDKVVENFRNELERLLNPSDPNAKKNRLIFEPKVKIDEEAFDFDEPYEHDRRRHSTQTEMFKACRFDDAATSSRLQKGKNKVVDGDKKGDTRKKRDRDGDTDGDGDSDTY